MSIPMHPDPELGYRLPPFSLAITDHDYFTRLKSPKDLYLTPHTIAWHRAQLFWYRVRLSWLRRMVQKTNKEQSHLRGYYMREMFELMDDIRSRVTTIEELLNATP